MSGFSSSADSSSPSTPVTSSQDPQHAQNVVSPPPSTGPSPITTPVLAQHDGAKISSVTEKDFSASEKSDALNNTLPANLLHGEDSESSNANTPRLPPTLSSKSDLENIPTDPSSSLDNPEQLASAIQRPLASNGLISQEGQTTQSIPIPHTVSHPLSDTYVRSTSANQIYGSPPENQQGFQSTSFPKASSANKYSNLGGQPIPRQKSQDETQVPKMSGSDRRGGIMHGELDRSGLIGARHEAFSEQGKRSSSRSSSGRVDRQIEATVNEAEPTANARSRKSSHVLGLFRENTTPQEGLKGSRRSKRASAEFVEASPLHQLKESGNSEKENDGSSVPKPHDDLAPNEKHFGPDFSPSHRQDISAASADQRGPEFQQQPLSPSVGGAQGKEVLRSSDFEECSCGDETTHEDHHASMTAAVLPPKLLEQIRGYHNLAPPFHDKFRSTQTRLPSSETVPVDKERPTKTEDNFECDKDDQKSDDPNRSSASPTDDDEDSDKEQISSALYYPHQVPSPEALQDVSIDDARKAREAEEPGPQLPEPAISTSAEEAPEEVDITLQSHNKSKYLHGDLPKAGSASAVEANYSQFLEGGSSSASESEYESAEEQIHPSLREDSSLTDDPDATPRASPTTRKSYLESRSRKSHRKPKPPVGAVELKPYNHQVGGHSRVFRFSKRAVCKELSNRENVFYEAVEHQHPELLKFLPR